MKLEALPASTYLKSTQKTTAAKKSGDSVNDTEIIPLFQDKNKQIVAHPGMYPDLMDRLQASATFQPRVGATQFLRFMGPTPIEHLLLVGLGTKEALTANQARIAGGTAFTKLSLEKSRNIIIQLNAFPKGVGPKGSTLSQTELLKAFLEGLLLHSYQFDKYKSDPHPRTLQQITVICDNAATLKTVREDLNELKIISESVNLSRDWSNEPSNIGTPEFYANEAIRLSKSVGIKCRILTEKEARQEKMELFLAVGQGSEREGRVIILEYTPKKNKKSSAKTIALVGKGITFDSGGISIKPATKMEDMKHDMTGASTIFGAIMACARLQLPHRVIAVLGFTENMPDGTALQPGNIIKARNGKTVEIVNTDAEGRLILADLLDLVQDQKPDLIIDLATLTGAVGIALGKQCGAILGNDEKLIATLRQASDVTGERLWPLPLFDEYLDDMRGQYADLRNSCNDSHGGVIRAAMFLKEFIRKDNRWVHLDIASMAYSLGSIPYFPKHGASGIYVRTLVEFIARYR